MKTRSLYNQLKTETKKNLGTGSVSTLFQAIFLESIAYLDRTAQVPITSKVEGKTYFLFSSGKKTSRAVNADLYLSDPTSLNPFFMAMQSNDWEALSAEEITQQAYTLAMAFITSVDLQKTGDVKTPGTFFELLCGHLVTLLLGVQPKKRIPVLNLDQTATLPTDFIFDLGENRPKFHVPIKTSTRERVIQVWAHQRVLDGIYGLERFKGTLICLSEVKKNAATHVVTEICLPTQWKVYQSFIARMHRVYYFDLPSKYEALNRQIPRITVLPFGSLFKEVERLSAGE
ncbi:hypothetical protein APED_26940 [Acanthopleuribacter pedis]